MDVFGRRRVLCGSDRWSVAEVDARAVPGALGERCLVCQSDSIVRRMWQYPANWESLSDVALAALCDGRLADVASPAADDPRFAEPEPVDRPSLHEARA